MSDELVRTRAKCPTCGYPAAIRFPRRVADVLSQLPPEQTVATCQCGNAGGGSRLCGTIIPIRAGHLQQAKAA